MLLLSDVRIVSIRQRREGGNYVACTAITLICSCLWGEGVSGGGRIDVYQRVEVAAASSPRSCACEWVFQALGISPRPSALG